MNQRPDDRRIEDGNEAKPLAEPDPTVPFPPEIHERLSQVRSTTSGSRNRVEGVDDPPPPPPPPAFTPWAEPAHFRSQPSITQPPKPQRSILGAAMLLVFLLAAGTAGIWALTGLDTQQISEFVAGEPEPAPLQVPQEQIPQSQQPQNRDTGNDLNLAAPPSFDTAAYGFVLADPSLNLLPNYTIRFNGDVTNRAPALHDFIDSVVAQANAEMTTTQLTVDHSETFAPLQDGEIRVGVNITEQGTPVCTFDPGQVGCASYTYVGEIIREGVVSVDQSFLSTASVPMMQEVILHEVLHILNLGHFDGEYNGSYQSMRWEVSDRALGTLGDGDRNGLRYMGNHPHGPLPVGVQGPPWATRCIDTGAPCG